MKTFFILLLAVFSCADGTVPPQKTAIVEFDGDPRELTYNIWIRPSDNSLKYIRIGNQVALSINMYVTLDSIEYKVIMRGYLNDDSTEVTQNVKFPGNGVKQIRLERR